MTKETFRDPKVICVWESKNKRFRITKHTWGLMFYHVKWENDRVDIENPIASLCWNRIRGNCSYFNGGKLLHLLNGKAFRIDLYSKAIWIFLFALEHNPAGFQKRFGIRITQSGSGLILKDWTGTRMSNRYSFE